MKTIKKFLPVFLLLALILTACGLVPGIDETVIVGGTEVVITGVFRTKNYDPGDGKTISAKYTNESVIIVEGEIFGEIDRPLCPKNIYLSFVYSGGSKDEEYVDLCMYTPALNTFSYAFVANYMVSEYSLDFPEGISIPLDSFLEKTGFPWLP